MEDVVIGGRRYLVGERGPEIFWPRQSGTVIPHHGAPSPAPPRGDAGADNDGSTDDDCDERDDS